MSSRIAGVLAPVVTPFRPDLSPDPERFVHHCRWLLAAGVGLAPFGTNSEANSMSVHERVELMSRLVDSAIDASRTMPGTGACAVPDAVTLSTHAVRLGCAGVLMLPPFYYKGVSEEGLYRYYAETIDRVGDARLRVYLYHIPPVSQVPLPLSLVERLLDDYPGTVAGIKDSGGDWNHTKSLIDRFGDRGFDVFAGSETFLLANLRAGGRGCISATANVNPHAIAALAGGWRDDGADERQHALDAVRGAFQRRPMIAAMKHAIAHWSLDPDWRTVRPPLVELDEAQSSALLADLAAIGFEMPGLAAGT